METLYVTFEITVSNSEYSYGGRHGISRAKMQLPREMVETFEPGNLLRGVLQAALSEYEKLKETEEDDNEE